VEIDGSWWQKLAGGVDIGAGGAWHMGGGEERRASLLLFVL